MEGIGCQEDQGETDDDWPSRTLFPVPLVLMDGVIWLTHEQTKYREEALKEKAGEIKRSRADMQDPHLAGKTGIKTVVKIA